MPSDAALPRSCPRSRPQRVVKAVAQGQLKSEKYTCSVHVEFKRTPLATLRTTTMQGRGMGLWTGELKQQLGINRSVPPLGLRALGRRSAEPPRGEIGGALRWRWRRCLLPLPLPLLPAALRGMRPRSTCTSGSSLGGLSYKPC